MAKALALLPVKVGVVVLVTLSAAMPLSLVAASCGWANTEALTVRVKARPALVLPAKSVCTAVKLCTPAASGWVRLTDQVPSVPTVVEARVMTPS